MHKIILGLLIFISLTAGAQNAEKEKAERQNAATTLLPTADNQLMQRSLNGTWKFRLVDGGTLPTALSDWQKSDWDDKDWSDINVPGCWETQGFCTASYGKTVPERHGLYRKKFVCPKEWRQKGNRIFLRIEAASMSYQCYINGKSVGGYDRAHLPCNFDITPYLNDGDENTVCVDVSTRGHSWLFDVVDNWTYCGINRDVSIFCVNENHISDVTFTSEIATKDSATVSVKACIVSPNVEELSLTATIKEPSGRTVWTAKTAVKGANDYTLTGGIDHPILWTAETPTLYNLHLTLATKKGEVLYTTERRVGLRDVKVDGRKLLVNGQQILLHGVCVSESHPYLGAAYTAEEWRRQLAMMKQANINFIRTAHYPMHPSLYDLADEMGFYICDEIPFASRGSEYLKAGTHLEELYTRAAATIGRDKNHPSVIMWSMGNENPVTVGEVITRVKELDPSRPRGVPQTIGAFSKMMAKPHPDVNLLMGHYFNPTRLKEVEEKATLPFVQTEYGHSLGLAMGDFQDRWERIVNTYGFVGGSVWCWQDGGTVSSKCPTAVCKGVWVDSLHYLNGYGHDLHKGADERGKEAIDGIIYADGKPQEDYYLIRKMYSPVQLLADTLRLDKPLTVANRNDFVSLDGYTLRYRLTDQAQTLAEGCVALHAPARQQETVNLSNNGENLAEALDKASTISDCGDLFVDFTVTAPSGAPIHERTLPVGKCADYASLLTNLQCDKQYNIKVERDGRVVITHKKYGEMVNSPLLLRIDRPLTATGVHRPGTKSRWSEYILKPQMMDVSTKKTAEGKSTIVSCRWKRNGKETEYIDGEVDLTVLANGTVRIDYSISASDSVKRSFTEVGLALKMSKSLGSFLWLGRGRYASFPDKYLHNEPGIWALSHDDFRFNGNRSGVRIACLADNDGNGLYVVPEGNKLGVENVDGNIVLTHNLSVAGIGSKSTAPCNMLKADRMRNLTGSLLLKPVSANMETPLWLLPFKKVEAIVPEKPYYKSYGW